MATIKDINEQINRLRGIDKKLNPTDDMLCEIGIMIVHMYIELKKTNEYLRILAKQNEGKSDD